MEKCMQMVIFILVTAEQILSCVQALKMATQSEVRQDGGWLVEEGGDRGGKQALRRDWGVAVSIGVEIQRIRGSGGIVMSVGVSGRIRGLAGFVGWGYLPHPAKPGAIFTPPPHTHTILS